jgi:fumarate reductase iron-sulfur subunit
LAAKTITLSVTRFDPGQDPEPRQQSYEIPFEDDMVVLDGLNWIKTHLDGSVATAGPAGWASAAAAE